MMTKSEEINKIFLPLEKKLSYDTEFKITFGKGLIINKAVRLMKTHLTKAAEKDPKDVKITDADRGVVRQAVQLVLLYAIEKPMTSYYLDFVGEFMPIASNWNGVLGKNKPTETHLKSLQAILRDRLTRRESLSIMRQLLKKLRGELRYTPPAIQHAEHYLGTLKKEIEESEGC